MTPPRSGDGWSGMGIGWAVTSTMVAGVLAWGGIGFLVDRLFGSSDVFTALGIVLGAAGGTYLVYVRYGRDDGERTERS